MDIDLNVFDVGHGASSLVRVADGTRRPTAILVDGGTKSKVPVKQLRSLLGSNSVLDLVVLTHIHQDHCAGVVRLFREWEGAIRRLWIPYPTRHLVDLAAALSGGEDVAVPECAEEWPWDGPFSIADRVAECALPRLKDEDLDADEECAGSRDGRDDEDRIMRRRHAADVLRTLADRLTGGHDLDGPQHYALRDLLFELDSLVFDDPGYHEDYRLWHALFRYLNIAPVVSRARTSAALYAIAAALVAQLDIESVPRARQIESKYLRYSMTKGNGDLLCYAFNKTMASYRSLNELLKVARRKPTPVVVSQMCTAMAMGPLAAESRGAQLRAVAPSYKLIHEIERSLRKQDGEAYNESLAWTCLLQAANVIGGAVRLEAGHTSILFPGDSDLQDVAKEMLASDVVLCPHHGGQSGSFPSRFAETLANEERLRTMVISKATDTKRPSEEWIEIFRGHANSLEVYCTQPSKVKACKGCDPDAWKTKSSIHLAYRNSAWVLANGAGSARCPVIENNRKSSERVE